MARLKQSKRLYSIAKIVGAKSGVRFVDGRVISPSLADPGMSAAIESVQNELFPNRTAVIKHFKKRGMLTSGGQLTKAFR